MALSINVVEDILMADPRLRPIYESKYELSFESNSGLQLAVSRKNAVKAVRFWIQNTVNPDLIGFSPSVEVKPYPPAKPRAHLSANLLKGPYRGGPGNDCWLIAVQDEAHVRRLLAAYLR